MVFLVALAIEVGARVRARSRRRSLRGRCSSSAVIAGPARRARLDVAAGDDRPSGTHPRRRRAGRHDRRATSTRPTNFGDNLRGQLAATEPLYDQDVDVVLWPEGASDSTRSRSRGGADFDAVPSGPTRPRRRHRCTARRHGDGRRQRRADLPVLQHVDAVARGGGRRSTSTTSGIRCRSASTCPTARSGASSPPT